MQYMENRVNNEFQEKLSMLAAAYAKGLPEKIDEIEAMWNQLLASWSLQTMRDLHRVVHNLAGNGKIFGFPELSAEARTLEQMLKQLLQQDIPTDETQSDKIFLQIAELKRIFTENESKPSENIIQTIVKAHDDSSVNQVFVVDHDAEAAEELALQLRYYGYAVEIFDRIDKFQEAMQQKPDAVVLMEVEFPDDTMGGIHAMEKVHRMLGHSARAMFISAHDNMEFRLEAVRAGGIAYFVKPFNPLELINQLDLITASQEQDSFRILIVDDNQTTLSYHTTLLERAEMAVKTVSDPLSLMAVLKDFNPDLILMDLYMLKCSGIELAKVIRQLDGFVSTPIVYLSTENDFNTQVEAMSLNGDDFMIKPVASRQLISTVTMRVMRARALHSLMTHDSLTGLLNHTAIKEEMAREVVRANRLSTPLSFAMVDIDFFDKINDRYGYAAGDRVIKSLSRLLKQRLRGTDVIGRYGGEEFAVIMNDTDATAGARVIDEVRNVFSRLVHTGSDEEFSASFSCGIADVVNFQDAASLIEAAEKALFQAKQRGRNKVVVVASDD